MNEPVREQVPPEEKPIRKRIPRSGTNKKTPYEREALAVKVARLRADRGLTFEQIAKELHVCKDTAWRAYKRFMAEFAKYHHSDASVLLAEYHSRAERVWRAHYAKYQVTVDPNTGIGDVSILREAMRLQNDEFDKMQSAGLIPTAKKEFSGEIEHTGSALSQFIWGKKEAKQ